MLALIEDYLKTVSASNVGISISGMDAKISILSEIVRLKVFMTLDKVKSLYDTVIYPAICFNIV